MKSSSFATWPILPDLVELVKLPSFWILCLSILGLKNVLRLRHSHLAELLLIVFSILFKICWTYFDLDTNSQTFLGESSTVLI